MAAGLGSRYGGLKQMTPINRKGEIIIDFSLYDAMMAGFKRVIFIIKKEMEVDFRELIDGRAGRHLETIYVFQDINDLPEGYALPEGRVKPWGTCHAVMTCKDVIDGNFAVINADDYYGAGGFQLMYDYLDNMKESNERYEFAMIGYPLANTLTEHGSVARGVCEVDDEGYLASIVERKRVFRKDGQVVFQEGKECAPLREDSFVSMNFWGFSKSMMTEMTEMFPAFLDKLTETDELSAEYLLPSTVDELIQKGKARVRLLKTNDKWHGVTYKEDKQYVVDALQSYKDKGLYPEHLWK
jgi:dTDP-glucose pyrophosphorylase